MNRSNSQTGTGDLPQVNVYPSNKNLDERIDKILGRAGVPKGIHRIVGANELSPVDMRDEAKTALLQLLIEARLDGVKEIKRRWDEDRKTMDYSPDTYQFICDKYITELEASLAKKEGSEDHE